MEQFFSQNPWFLGAFLAVVGLLIMVGAILRWGWIIGNDPAGNKVKVGLFGWIIYKLFGRRVFFIMTGAVMVLGGIALAIAFTYLA